MKKVAVGIVAALALSVAQAREPWERRAALAEAQRGVGVAQPLLAESERGDPRPAVKALQDPSWAVRLLACDRLEAAKLQPELLAALRRECGPGKSGPERDEPDWKAAWEFADAVTVGGEIPNKPTRDHAVRALVAVILARVREGSESTKHALLQEALPYLQLVKGQTQRWIAGQVAQLMQPQVLLDALGAKDLNEALGPRGRPVIAWYAAHRERLVWNRRAKAFSLGPPR